jgi:hypothetical protein
MSRRGVTFWGTARSREGGKFRRGVLRPTAPWPAEDRAIVRAHLVELRESHPDASVAWLVRELNRWRRTEPKVPLPRPRKKSGGKRPKRRYRPLEVPRVFRATHVEELLSGLERLRASSATGESARRATNRSQTPKRLVRRDNLRDDTTSRPEPARAGIARPTQTRTSQTKSARLGPEDWPPVYRQRLQGLLTQHLAAHPGATIEQLRKVASRFHSQNAAGFPSLPAGIRRSDIMNLMEPLGSPHGRDGDSRSA